MGVTGTGPDGPRAHEKQSATSSCVALGVSTGLRASYGLRGPYGTLQIPKPLHRADGDPLVCRGPPRVLVPPGGCSSGPGPRAQGTLGPSRIGGLWAPHLCQAWRRRGWGPRVTRPRYLRGRQLGSGRVNAHNAVFWHHEAQPVGRPDPTPSEAPSASDHRQWHILGHNGRRRSGRRAARRPVHRATRWTRGRLRGPDPTASAGRGMRPQESSGRRGWCRPAGGHDCTHPGAGPSGAKPV